MVFFRKIRRKDLTMRVSVREAGKRYRGSSHSDNCPVMFCSVLFCPPTITFSAAPLSSSLTQSPKINVLTLLYTKMFSLTCSFFFFLYDILVSLEISF